MSRGKWIGVVIVLLAVLGAALYLDPDARLIGLLRGEAKFQGKSSSAWRADLGSSDPATLASAREALMLGKRDSVPVLVELLGGTGNARLAAADILGQLGPDAASAAPALTACLSADDPQLRVLAARSLAAAVPTDAGAAQAILAVSEKIDKVELFRTLSKFGPAAGDAVPLLRQHLEKSHDTDVRWNALRTLGKLRAPSKPAVPEIIALLNDPERLVREHAAEALGDIGPLPEAVAPLTATLHDPDARVRRDAVRALGQMGATAKPALAEVQRLVNDPEEIVRESAVKASRLIDPSLTDKK